MASFEWRGITFQEYVNDDGGAWFLHDSDTFRGNVAREDDGTYSAAIALPHVTVEGKGATPALALEDALDDAISAAQETMATVASLRSRPQ